MRECVNIFGSEDGTEFDDTLEGDIWQEDAHPPESFVFDWVRSTPVGAIFQHDWKWKFLKTVVTSCQRGARTGFFIKTEM